MITLPTQTQIKILLTPELTKILETNDKIGLTSDEVKTRLAQFGYNEIPEVHKNIILVFLKNFWGLSAWLIESIAILSLFMHKLSDFSIATSLLFINAVIGFLQERRAQNVIQILQAKLQIQARILRDNKWYDIPAKELVPGDIVRLRMGDFAPADLIVLSGTFSVDQSSLTGESKEIEKKTGDQVYSTSIVRQGEFLGMVVFTGSKTFYGRTVELVQKSYPKLHMEEVVSQLVKWLLGIVGCVVLLVIIVGIFRESPMSEVLPLSLVLLMSAIPIALPVMFTVSTSIGARDLGKKGVLITRLSATEDAATMQVLCIDKTGTLTLNQLVVEGLYPEQNITSEDLLLSATLASNVSNRDAIDEAILNHAKKLNLQLKDYKQTQFIPFSPTTRKTEANIESVNGSFKVMKGALKTIASEIKIPADQQKRLEDFADQLAKKGFRTLAIAKTSTKQTQFMGLIALYDPPRTDSSELITKLHALGVQVKMLTGDTVQVAQQIATEVGLGKVIEMDALKLENLEWLKDNDGIAAVFPEDKYKIIKALQNKKIITGMTGDGVNDSPALQVAEVGIAVKGSTDAARASASVVLTEQGLIGIIHLVENGRSVYQRILTWVINKISRTVLKTGFVGLAFIFTGHLLISALGMLVVTFMTDFVKITLATDHVRPSQTPDNWEIRSVTMVAVILGFCMMLEGLGLLWFGIRYTGIKIDSHEIHTFSFLILLFMGLFSILCIRERGPFWKSAPSATLSMALFSDGIVGIIIGKTGFGDLSPLPMAAIQMALVGSIIFSLLLNDFLKLWLYKTTTKRVS